MAVTAYVNNLYHSPYLEGEVFLKPSKWAQKTLWRASSNTMSKVGAVALQIFFSPLSALGLFEKTFYGLPKLLIHNWNELKNVRKKLKDIDRSSWANQSHGHLYVFGGIRESDLHKVSIPVMELDRKAWSLTKTFLSIHGYDITHPEEQTTNLSLMVTNDYENMWPVSTDLPKTE